MPQSLVTVVCCGMVSLLSDPTFILDTDKPRGSRASNFGGILSQGLRIAPPEAPVNGYMFGKVCCC